MALDGIIFGGMINSDEPTRPQDMMGSMRDLGGVRPPLHTKVDFIEKYKQQKLDVV